MSKIKIAIAYLGYYNHFDYTYQFKVTQKTSY